MVCAERVEWYSCEKGVMSIPGGTLWNWGSGRCYQVPVDVCTVPFYLQERPVTSGTLQSVKGARRSGFLRFRSGRCALGSSALEELPCGKGSHLAIHKFLFHCVFFMIAKLALHRIRFQIWKCSTIVKCFRICTYVKRFCTCMLHLQASENHSLIAGVGLGMPLSRRVAIYFFWIDEWKTYSLQI